MEYSMKLLKLPAVFTANSCVYNMTLEAEREPRNVVDRYAGIVKKDESINGTYLESCWKFNQFSY